MVRRKSAKRPVLPNQPKRRKVPGPKRNRGNNKSVVHPLAHCVYGPVNQAGYSAGVPDGCPDPTVVLEHRQTVVLHPDATGNIAFALCSSPTGAIGLGTGSAIVTVNALNRTTGTYTGNNTWEIKQTAAAPADGVMNYPIIPFNENLYAKGTFVEDASRSGGTLRATEFRVITAQASVSYTGSAMQSSGTAVTSRMKQVVTNSNYYNSGLVQYVSDMAQHVPTSLTDISAMPGARAFSVREPVTMVNPPECFDWQPMRNAWTPAVLVDGVTEKYSFTFCQLVNQTVGDQTGSTPTWGPSLGMGHAPVSYYYASGLDSTATITITTRSCIEYKLAFDSVTARFAKMGPPPQPAALTNISRIGRVMPSSIATTPKVETSGFLSVLSSIGKEMLPIISSVGSSVLTGSPLPSLLGLTNKMLKLTM